MRGSARLAPSGRVHVRHHSLAFGDHSPGTSRLEIEVRSRLDPPVAGNLSIILRGPPAPGLKLALQTALGGDDDPLLVRAPIDAWASYAASEPCTIANPSAFSASPCAAGAD